MCGIAGIIGYAGNADCVSREELLRVRDHMANRGPDSSGVWLTGDGKVGLAHRRLSIIDLSDAGAQPMESADGRLRIVFNGEIYNYRELREDLEKRGYRFRSTSDTEVLLALYERKGIEFLQDLRGMYAFGLWDEESRSLLLARDPYGIKPLYYADNGSQVRFASQVKALLAGGGVDAAPDPAGHVGFFLWGHLPSPYTLYRGIRELRAGHYMWIRPGGIQAERSFLDVPSVIRESADNPPPMPPEKAREILHHALKDSVKKHLVSDVEVYTFLSAGLDSSMLLALGMEDASYSLHAITASFPEYQGTDKDEAPAAAAIARHYGATHHIREVRTEDFRDELPRMLAAMDQPSIDGINTYCVSKVTAELGVKVALSGLGGDELLGGYDTFRKIPAATRKLRALRPLPGVGRGFRRASAPFLKGNTSPKYAGLLEYGTSYAGAYLLRRGLFMPWELPGLLDPEMVKEGWHELQPMARLEETVRGIDSGHCKVAALEMAWYMRHQLLRDSDWAGMAHSLEIRVPLVDTTLLKTLAPLMGGDSPPTKRDAIRSLAKPLPDEIVNRPKTGFNIPIREWLVQLNGAAPPEPGLRPWARHLYRAFVG